MQGEQDVRCPLKFPATPSGGTRLKRVRAFLYTWSGRTESTDACNTPYGGL